MDVEGAVEGLQALAARAGFVDNMNSNRDNTSDNENDGVSYNCTNDNGNSNNIA